MSEGKPEALSAVVTAQGPGRASTEIPYSLASWINLNPGSEMVGVPASDTKATLSPDFIALINLGILLSWLNSKKLRSNPLPLCFLDASIFSKSSLVNSFSTP